MTAHPWLHETPWPTKKLPRDRLEERIEHLLVMQNMGALGTVNADGSPLTTPVEYYAEGLTLYMLPQPGSPKIKNILRDSRDCFAVNMPLTGWTSTRGAQLFGKGTLLDSGTPEHDYACTIIRWQPSAVDLGRDGTVKPTAQLLRINPDKVVYTEHWLRREGFGPRQIWRKADG